MLHSTRIRQLAEAAWRKDAEAPSQEVLDQIETSAQKGYAWCIVPAEKLSGANLHWLSLEGFRIRKLLPKPGQDQSVWRIEWAFNIAEQDHR